MGAISRPVNNRTCIGIKVGPKSGSFFLTSVSIEEIKGIQKLIKIKCSAGVGEIAKNY